MITKLYSLNKEQEPNCCLHKSHMHRRYDTFIVKVIGSSKITWNDDEPDAVS